jgi:soluble lytic murein transglycosylase-like protein
VATGGDLYKQRLQSPILEASILPLPVEDPQVTAIERQLQGYGVEENRTRIAVAIVAKSRKYNIDPRLVGSVMIVESRANPYAISQRDSVGVMQVHLPTWGPTVEQGGLNLFKIEDNVELGVRILKGYVTRYGLWHGVMRYKGWNENPQSLRNATEYADKIRRIYEPGFTPTVDVVQTSLQ